MAGTKKTTTKASAKAGTKKRKSKPLKPNFSTYIYRVHSATGHQCGVQRFQAASVCRVIVAR
ncbi:hypothetical protein ACHAWF_009530 [Thalassiosira exigua]